MVYVGIRGPIKLAVDMVGSDSLFSRFPAIYVALVALCASDNDLGISATRALELEKACGQDFWFEVNDGCAILNQIDRDAFC